MTRPVTLLVLIGDDGECDLHGAELAARQALPGVVFERVTPIEEPRLGAWLNAHRARRCRSLRDILRTPERLQPVVLDADLPG